MDMNLNKIISEDEIWKGAIKDDLIFNCFAENGELKEFRLNKTDCIHMLIEGNGGTGKTTLINSMLNILARRYHPTDLRMWVWDAKEDKILQETMHSLQHVDYKWKSWDSITYFLSNVAILIDNRIRELKKANCRNSVEFNEMIMRGKAYTYYNEMYESVIRELDTAEGHDFKPTLLTSRDLMPEVVIFIDGLPLIFDNLYSDKSYSLRAILNKLLRYGRTLGIHLVISGVRLSDYLPTDILEQFGLRFVSRTSNKSSKDLLGSDVTSNIAEHFGTFYVKEGLQSKPELCKTLFISEREVIENLRVLRGDPPIREGEVESAMVMLNKIFEGLKERESD